MKKIVKLLSGLALVAALTFVILSSFKAPEQVENNCCPPGWVTTGASIQDVNIEQWDTNGDGVLCKKIVPGNNAKGNNKGTGTKKPKNYKDNNQPCD
jgi:hypothetical protein